METVRGIDGQEYVRLGGAYFPVVGWIRMDTRFLEDPVNQTYIDKEPILQFFVADHLPDHLAAVSRPFGAVAMTIVDDLPRNPERTVALRYLLLAKDAAVRARLYVAPALTGSDRPAKAD